MLYVHSSIKVAHTLSSLDTVLEPPQPPRSLLRKRVAEEAGALLPGPPAAAALLPSPPAAAALLPRPPAATRGAVGRRRVRNVCVGGRGP